MKVRLESDFVDFYDAWFDKGDDALVLERNKNSGLNRGQMFKYLENIGCRVVRHGSCEEMKAIGCKQLVVYTDTTKHDGEGKVLMSSSDAVLSVPNYLCSEYQSEKVGYSVRYLQLGEFWFKLECISHNDWRSNCGSEKVVNVIEKGYGLHKIIKAPIFAVDFVQSSGGLVATDFNIAPKADVSYLNDMTKPMDIANSIKKMIGKMREAG